ncbi:MAG: hypothetical protein R3246_12690, partial [Acidimicrobiia bacterium]|nr:hypothetical protein [Acidimicrobiia bacterium]
EQSVDATFGGILGISDLQTSAVAVALLNPGQQAPPIIPYGISGGTGSGEACFGNGPTGTAFPPCSGPSSGTFGTLLSEFFGDFYGTVDCGNPGATEIATGTAIGIDHTVSQWLNPDGLAITPGDPHPGDGTVLAYTDTHRDACTNSGGVAVAVDSYPVNTVRVDTGFPSNAMESGLVSEDTFYGSPSRLQQAGEHFTGATLTTNSTRDVVKRRQGANNIVWPLDNHGPWDYLLSTAVSVDSTCDPTTYTNALDEFQKAARFNLCLAAYGSSGPVIFDDALDRSPRFVWAPQYWFDLPTTGLSWEPVLEYRMSFIAGVYFNCSGASCAVVFYPDQHQTSELCDPGGGSNCQVLSLDQFSAWVLPDSAVNDRIRGAFPGGQTPYEPELFR